MEDQIAVAVLGAALSGSSIGQAILWLFAAALIYYVLNWGLRTFNPPEPFNKVIQVFLVLLVCFLIINAILMVVGHPIISVRW